MGGQEKDKGAECLAVLAEFIKHKGFDIPNDFIH